MIPKMAIDQANLTHREKMRRIWDAYLAEMGVIWKVLLSAYTNAKKVCDAGVNATQKARKARLDDAWKAYQRATRTGEESSYGTYDEEKLTIDAECNKEIEHANEVYEKAVISAEEAFRKGKALIQEKYKADTIDLIDIYFEAHP